jgi:Rrf2 family protein
MLCLSRKTDYALIALAYLAEHRHRVSSAREIAAAYGLPQPLLMNILKRLHRHDLVLSTRGVKGGYQLGEVAERTSLYDLVRILELKTADPDAALLGCGRERGPMEAPIQALQYRLIRFLKDVQLSDLIRPGHRIDVPLERVAARRGTSRSTNSTRPSAELVPA